MVSATCAWPLRSFSDRIVAFSLITRPEASATPAISGTSTSRISLARSRRSRSLHRRLRAAVLESRTDPRNISGGVGNRYLSTGEVQRPRGRATDLGLNRWRLVGDEISDRMVNAEHCIKLLPNHFRIL